MKVLDSSFLIDLINGKKETKEILNLPNLFTTQINMYEIIRGFYLRKISSNKFLQIMELFESIRVLPLNDQGILKSAEISAKLIENGKIIDDADCLTAGIALSHNIKTIVTKNKKHFSRIKDIKVQTY
ncbi:type II toxin-antitoxin system VapC family toxin [Candidatus Woesearchaeota archaeon]|jgi:predicted nucleic acid-binding protein|nr:type II toxin-antitoxin system VapC family toxin [Candidatus Woesearchaeota archaeon]MBT5739896.1 type II toxin-antitoxin system VapC family toxin [Candidatus Woesearchaeota archaeon]